MNFVVIQIQGGRRSLPTKKRGNYETFVLNTVNYYIFVFG